MKVISLKIDEEMDDILATIASRKRISKSELIRRALRNYIIEHSGNKVYITRRVKVY